MEDEQSEKTIEEQEEMLRGGRGGGGTSFALINEDLLHNILSRLPALSFASAARVSRSWNRVSNRILSRPKLASALSLNSTLQDAVKEVLDKVLSVPIRPHFAVACIGLKFSLKTAHKLIAKRLGSTTPIITSVACGIIGSDARTNNFREVKWGDFDGGLNAEAHNLPENVNRGIVLIVGFVPGLKVDAIPLLQSMEEPHASMVDKFVMDIRHYTASVSGSTSPSAILMIGNQHADMKPVLDKLDYAMSTETVIAGDKSGCFLFGSEDNFRYLSGISEDLCDAVALVFARDRDKSEGIGETQFHVTLSTGVSPVGPTHKAVSVRVKGIKSDCSTWLTARREGLKGTLDGQRMLNDINDEMENSIACHDLYIGVTKRRKCSIGLEKARLVTSFAFHEVLGSFTPTKDALFHIRKLSKKKNSILSLCKSNDAGSDASPPEGGNTRQQELLARIAMLQAQKVRLTDYLDERSAYLTQFAEEANAEFDEIGENALKELDDAGARIMENIESQMQAFEESAELNREDIEKNEKQLADFEDQVERGRNEGMFFKNLGQRAPIEKANAKEEMEKIRELTKENAGSKTRKNIYLALIGLLVIGISDALISSSSDWQKVAILGVISMALLSQFISHHITN